MFYVKGRSFFKGKMFRPGQKTQVSIAGGKVGATAGWTANTALDTALAHLPASQTASTFILPLPPMKPGTVISGFHINGCCTSAGGALTLDASLHKQVPASGAVPTDSSVAAMTQLAVTGSAVIGSSNAEKNSFTETVVDGSSYYLLIKGTTAASTSIDLTSATVEFNEAA
jgi:hypothetical protein